MTFANLYKLTLSDSIVSPKTIHPKQTSSKMPAYTLNLPDSPTLGHSISDYIIDLITSPEYSHNPPEDMPSLTPTTAPTTPHIHTYNEFITTCLLPCPPRTSYCTVCSMILSEGVRQISTCGHYSHNRCILGHLNRAIEPQNKCPHCSVNLFGAAKAGFIAPIEHQMEVGERILYSGSEGDELVLRPEELESQRHIAVEQRFDIMPTYRAIRFALDNGRFLTRVIRPAGPLNTWQFLLPGQSRFLRPEDPEFVRRYGMGRGARMPGCWELFRNDAELNGSTPASESGSLAELQAHITAYLEDIAATTQGRDHRQTACQNAARRKPYQNDTRPNNPDLNLPNTHRANIQPRTARAIISGRRLRVAAASPRLNLSNIDPHCDALLAQAHSVSLEQGRQEGIPDDEIHEFHAFPALQVWTDPALMTSVSGDARQRLMCRVVRELMLIVDGVYD
jgi:hypothetical protein